MTEELKTNLEKIWVLIRLGKNELAFTQVSALLVQYPNEAELHYAMAAIFYNENELEKCEDSLLATLRLEPEMTSALNLLGSGIYLGRDEFEKAQDLLEKCLKLSPYKANYYADLALLYIRKNESEMARYYLQTGLSYDSENVDCLKCLYIVLFIEGKENEAYEVVKQVLTKAPEHIDALSVMARRKLNRGELDNAEESFRAILSKEPDHEFALESYRKTLLESSPIFSFLNSNKFLGNAFLFFVSIVIFLLLSGALGYDVPIRFYEVLLIGGGSWFVMLQMPEIVTKACFLLKSGHYKDLFGLSELRNSVLTSVFFMGTQVSLIIVLSLWGLGYDKSSLLIKTLYLQFILIFPFGLRALIQEPKPRLMKYFLMAIIVLIVISMIPNLIASRYSFALIVMACLVDILYAYGIIPTE